MKTSLFLNIIKMILVLLISILIGIVLLMVVFSLSITRIHDNVYQSAPIFEKEGTYPVLTKFSTSQLDNYTDALMLENAMYDGEENILERSMMAYHIAYEGMNPAEALVAYYHGDQSYFYEPYSRYWHGYLVVLKPLLISMDYKMIRILNFVLQSILTFSVFLILWKKKMIDYIVPYALMVLLLVPLATAFSLQFSSVFYIFTMGSIVLLLFYEKWRNTNRFLFFFLILGIVTSFVDFLTYPLVTFGIPMTLYICLSKERKILNNLLEIIKFLACWGFGYVGMWVGKWFAGSILTKENIIGDAITQLGMRMSMYSADMDILTYRDVYRNNIALFIKNPTIILVLIFMIISILFIIKKHRTERMFRYSLVFGLIAILPFIWYIGASNHSYVHAFFTHKELVITAFAMMCLPMKAKNRPRKVKRLKKESDD